MRRLVIEIDCGEDTCASAPRKFCAFLGSRKFGQHPVCRLFPGGGQSFTDLTESGGWVQRCAACKRAEGETP